MKKGMLIIGLLVVGLSSMQKVRALSDDYMWGAVTGSGIGAGVYLADWAFNKYLKAPLRHINDDVMALYDAINRLKKRLQKTIDENDRKKWASHKFEPGRIALMKQWLNAPDFRKFEEFISYYDWEIGRIKKKK